MKLSNKFINSLLLPAMLGILMSLLAFSVPQTSEALSGADFRAGKIIDDGVFFNPNGMSVSQIQNFLNSKVPVCDTNGSQPYGGSTRAAYGTSRGYPPPYSCLKDYSQNTANRTADDLCNGYTQGTHSSAQIIYNVAQSCGVNPKVLIVLLQKEQSLISDDWPWSVQYRSATGYGCPDTAPCDAEYYGFFNQVYSAARQFKRYVRDSNTYNYRPFRENYIQYNPNASCGGSNVYIHNYATAGLYNYTPYQPNASALANLYGTGDSCGAYGNRNFWRLYNDWFNIHETIFSGLTVVINSQPDKTPFKGQSVSYTFTFTNRLSIPLTFDTVGAVARAGSINGANRDFGWTAPVTIQAGQSRQFTMSTIIRDTGNIYVWPAVSYQGTYVQYNNWGSNLSSRNPNISLTSPLTSSVANPIASQTSTISATIRNNEAENLNISALGIPIRFYDRYTYDTGWSTPAGSIIAPGTSRTVSGNVTFDKPGPYTAWVSGLIAGQYTTLSPILKINVSQVNPKFGLTYTETPNATPSLGEDVVVKFKLKNNTGIPMTLNAVGVVGRYDSPFSTSSVDLGWQGPISFGVGEEKSFTTFSRNISQNRNHYLWPAFNYQGKYYQYNSNGFMLIPHKPSISTTPQLQVNGGSSFSVGQTVPITITLKNNEPRAVKYTAVGIPVRYYDFYNYDATWQGPGTLAPSGQPGDSITLSGNVRFDKPGPYKVWSSMLINGQYITVSNILTLNL